MSNWVGPYSILVHGTYEKVERILILNWSRKGIIKILRLGYNKGDRHDLDVLFNYVTQLERKLFKKYVYL